METAAPPTPNPALDPLVARYVDLQLEAERIKEQLGLCLDQIRAFGLGRHSTSYGLRVSVSRPNRRFNLETACSLLPPAALETCRLDGYDPAKVKAILPPVLLDRAMEPGTGAYRVTIK